MRKLLVSFIFVFLFSLPTMVLAQSSLIMDCSDTNIAGKTLSCILKTEVDSEVTYNKIEANLDLDSSNVTFEWESGFSGNLSNNKLIINSTSEQGNSTVGKMNIKFPVTTTGNKQINITNINLYNNDSLVQTINNVSDTVTVKSDVKTLESLLVSDCDGCKLSPSFDSDLTIYTITTTSDTISFKATASGNATVTGDGTKKITKDKETFEIIVTSEAGNTKKYKITVSKEKLLSNDNSLKELNIDSGTLDTDFTSDVTNYKATVDKAEVIINAEASDAKATISGVGKKLLDYGKNEFTIMVTAENGNSKSYLITINRPDTRNANAYLKELTINGEQIDFEKDILEYTYTVDNSVIELDIGAIPELETSTVTVTGNKDLIVGENEVIITIVAEDESTKEYKIIVTRDEIDRSELFLSELIIEGYDIDFYENVYEYDIFIDDEKNLVIDAIPENDDYIVEISGNSNLKNGSVIRITITDQEGNSNVYKINVSAEENSEIIENNNETDDINYIPIIMTSLLIVLAILDTLQIIKMFRNK